VSSAHPSDTSGSSDVSRCDRLLRIRTVTAGVSLSSAGDLDSLRAAVEFVLAAGKRFEASGYEVQTLRVATQPAGQYLGDWAEPSSLSAIRQLDAVAADAGVLLNLGPFEVGSGRAGRFSEWAAQTIAKTSCSSLSLAVTTPAMGPNEEHIRAAAQTILAIARATPSGEGNFQFAAAANVPAGTPFFPVAYHQGMDAFGIGCEPPRILGRALAELDDGEAIETVLGQALAAALGPVAEIAESLAVESGRAYSGIDTSLAPSLDASIGEVVERISGRPFGASGTLAACALLTTVAQSLDLRTCGYRGLMLPVLEDPVLASRASRGDFSVRELLLFSAVCGTGLDVVPLAGDVPVETLEGLVVDVAALSNKLAKPLSVRLFPIPGRSAGDLVDFESPYLTSARIMKLS